MFFYYDNLFIFAFDIEEKREIYNKAFSTVTSSSNGYIPRIGNFFERNGKYYLIGDYDDTKLADVGDAAKNNNVLYRGVVIHPVIYSEQVGIKSRIQDTL